MERCFCRQFCSAPPNSALLDQPGRCPSERNGAYSTGPCWWSCFCLRFLLRWAMLRCCFCLNFLLRWAMLRCCFCLNFLLRWAMLRWCFYHQFLLRWAMPGQRLLAAGRASALCVGLLAQFCFTGQHSCVTKAGHSNGGHTGADGIFI